MLGPVVETKEMTKRDFEEVVSILQALYNNGYYQRMTFEEKRQLRGRAYKLLKHWKISEPEAAN